jgi:hypothetical protein
VTLAAVAVAVPIAGVPAPAEARSLPPADFYGVVTQTPTLEQREVRRMRRGRVGAVRFVLPWNRVERLPGVFDWSSIDAQVLEISRAGARPIPFVFGRPTWLGETRAPPLGWPGVELGWQRFLRELVNRYGPGGSFHRSHPGLEPIRAWQVWNEPNLPAFWGFEQPDAADYVSLLELSAAAIRSVDRDAEIILAGLSPAPKGIPPPKYLRSIYRVYERRGVEPDFDQIALHPYAMRVRNSGEQARRFQQAAKQESGRKPPLLISEIGWGSARSRHPVGGTPRSQAKRLRRVFRMFRNNRGPWRISGVLWYAWRDVEPNHSVCDFCPYVGLFDSSGRSKPAWRMFKRTARR